MNTVTLVSKATKKEINGDQFTNWLRDSNVQGKLYIKSGALHVSSTPAQHQVLKFLSASVIMPMLTEKFLVSTQDAYIVAGKISAEFGGIPAKEIKAVTVTPATPAPVVNVTQCIEKALMVLDFSSAKVTKKEMADAVYQARLFLKQAKG